MRRLPPPTPAPPAAPGAIRGAAAARARQPSPFETPDCTTRTLAFDSAASSVAAGDAQLRRKRKRRIIDEAAAFVTARSSSRRARGVLDGEDSGAEGEEDEDEEVEEQHQQGGMASAAVSSEAPESDGARSNQCLDRSPAIGGKGLEEEYSLVRPASPIGADSKALAVDKLRRLVRSCSTRHHAAAALFYADKLIALSPRSPSDVLLFADACFSNQQYHRAIHAIKIARLVAVDGSCGTSHVRIGPVTLRAALLLGRSMLAIKQKEECLDIITKVLPEREQDIVALSMRISKQGEGGMFTGCEGLIQSDQEGINLVSSLALLIGETYEALGNRENATLYFRIALRCDVYCAEAFFHLFDKQMLTAEEEDQLVESLNYSEDEMGMLHALYQIQVGKYDASISVDAKFAHVEGTLGLHESLDLSVAKAETLYYQHDIQRAHAACQRIRERDPFNFRLITVFVATLVELGKKRELYHYAHQMVDVYPKKASAWYTVGCYYLLIEKNEAAQRYFHKATSLEPTYAPAWIGFGNSFAAQDESDQAMSSYRTASSLFPGSHFPPLYIGMEYLRTNNLLQAEQYIRQASVICPTDPLIYNELGTVYYKKKEFAHAVDMFVQALELSKNIPERLMDVWEPTLFNLGNSYRKLRMFDDAVHSFQSALRLSPRNTSVLAALGFTYHMKGDLELAIESYHAALAYNPEDSLAGSMITVAFEESLSSSHATFSRMTQPTRSPARVRAMRREPPSAGRGAVVGGSRLESVKDDSLLRRLDLDQSYSSIDRSRQSLAVSSLDFSDDSSMNMEED